MAIFDHIDRALRHLREGRRTRQYQIAEEAGITKAMLSAYETGKQKPSLETLDKLLNALGCDLVDLHAALSIFQSPSPRERPQSLAASRHGLNDRFPIPQPASEASLGGFAASPRTAMDVYSALRIEEPLEPGEEAALGEVLTSFHKLIRHLHETARRSAGPESGDEEPDHNGQPRPPR